MWGARVRREVAYQTFDHPPLKPNGLGAYLIGQLVIDFNDHVQAAYQTGQLKEPHGNGHAWTEQARHLHSEAETAKKLRTVNDYLTAVSCHRFTIGLATVPLVA